MNRHLVTVGAVCATLVLVSPVLADGIEGKASLLETGGKQIYLVKPGDTLAGIAGKVLGDSSRWPELMKANPQIVKADRIYPGDALVVGEAPVEAGQEPTAAGSAGSGGASAATARTTEAPAPAAVIAPEECMESSRLPAGGTALLTAAFIK